MNRFLSARRIGILFVGLFAILCAGIFVVQRFYIDPEDKCIASGRWWYVDDRECVQPVSIAELTGRPIGVSRAEASAQKNRELVEIEHRLEREKAARQAATDRDRQAILDKRGL